jgi:hypothetical protein
MQIGQNSNPKILKVVGNNRLTVTPYIYSCCKWQIEADAASRKARNTKQ